MNPERPKSVDQEPTEDAAPVAGFAMLGVAAITTGTCLLSIPVGLIVLGGCLLAIAAAYARGLA